MPPTAAIHRSFLAILLALAVFTFDQVAKVIITEFVMQPPREIPVTSFFNLVLSFNRGLSFGVLSDQFGERAIVLGLVQLGFAAIILAFALRATTRTDVAALALMAGGAAGNAMDRLQREAVIDFLDFHAQFSQFLRYGRPSQCRTGNNENMATSNDKKSTDRDGLISAASLQKPRRRRNLLMLVLLLIFVVVVYFVSFSHVGEEAGPPTPASVETGAD